jgi:hypothetical protein
MYPRRHRPTFLQHATSSGEHASRSVRHSLHLVGHPPSPEHHVPSPGRHAVHPTPTLGPSRRHAEAFVTHDRYCRCHSERLINHFARSCRSALSPAAYDEISSRHSALLRRTLTGFRITRTDLRATRHLPRFIDTVLGGSRSVLRAPRPLLHQPPSIPISYTLCEGGKTTSGLVFSRAADRE